MQIVKTFPQEYETIQKITLSDLIRVLPRRLKYAKNVWISGRLARDGKSSDNIVFILGMDKEPSSVMMKYFDKIVAPLNIHATASCAWRDRGLSALRIYNNGRLIIDRDLYYIELPSPIEYRQEITKEYVLERLPKEVSFKETIWLTGSVVKNGYSMNDVDFIVGSSKFNSNIKRECLFEMKNFFREKLKCGVHFGSRIMKEREPILVLKAYEKGKLCL